MARASTGFSFHERFASGFPRVEDSYSINNDNSTQKCPYLRYQYNQNVVQRQFNIKAV